jgi:hypothetical protein
MNEHDKVTDQQLQTIDATIHALGDLPIIEQLNFAESLLLSRGGSRQSEPADAILITAAEAVRSVMNIIKRHPEAAKLTASD